MKVIVAYASKYGSTKGIAEFIGDKLRERGVQVDLQEAGAARNVNDYDAFVIGSAVFNGHWMSEAKRFVSKNSAAMLGRPVWLFSSGPTGTQQIDAKGNDMLKASEPKELDELRALLNPRDHRVFFGSFYSERLTGTTGFFFKLAARSKSVRESVPEGDFRDWKAIEAWAVSIAEALQATIKGRSTSSGAALMASVSH